MNLSVCIITKNEANLLEKCLTHIKNNLPEVEVVVADTGSTDNSVEIAKKYTNKVFFFEWCNDFSKAKNYAINCASNDYVFVLDTDEFITKADLEATYRLIKSNPDKVGRIERVNVFERNKDMNTTKERINRIFDRRLFHYEGSIHEQVCQIDGTDYDTYNIPISTDHTGYDGTPEERYKKSQRNIALLEKELEKEPNPYILYQLGKSHFSLEEYDRAIYYFEQATAIDLDPRLEYVLDMITTYGYALINANRQSEALMFEGIFNDFSYSCDFIFLMATIYMENARFTDAIAMYEKATSYSDSNTLGANSYMAYYNIGVIYECLGNTPLALKYYKKCGSSEKALERINMLKKNV